VSRITFNRQTHACSYDRDGRSYGIVILIVGFALPLMITIVSYAIVYSSIERRHRQRTLSAAAAVSHNALAESSFITTDQDCLAKENGTYVSRRGETMVGKQVVGASGCFDRCFHRKHLMTLTYTHRGNVEADGRPPRQDVASAIFRTRSDDELSQRPSAIVISTLFCAEGVTSDVQFDFFAAVNSPAEVVVPTVSTSLNTLAKTTTKTAVTIATTTVTTSSARENNSPVAVSVCAGKSAFKSSGISRAQDRMLKRVTLSVCVNYLLCFGLYFYVNCADLNADQLPYWTHKMSAWLTYLHCCANPVVYGLTHRQFWNDFVSLVRRCTRR